MIKFVLEKSKIPTAMYELCKEILQKVSFDKSLFRKELIKSRKWLKEEELVKLQAWCLSTFIVYKEMINEVFNTNS
jgi:ACT domain-containing protein